MNSRIHILNKLGVLSSFSIAKKITEKDINKYFDKYKRQGKTEYQISKMLNDKILNDIQRAIKNDEIPGLLKHNMPLSDELDDKTLLNIETINKMVSIIVKQIEKKNYNKMLLCYFINDLVNSLQLTEEDFNKFHKSNFNTDNKDEDSDDSNDENEDGDDNGNVLN